MHDPAFINLLTNPILSAVLMRVFWLYFAGFILILILNKFKIKGIWQTNVGKRFLSWLIIGPVYLVFVLAGGYAALLFLLAILFLAIREIHNISNLPKPYIHGLMLMSFISVYVASFQFAFFYSLPLIYLLITTFIAFRENSAEKSFIHSAITMFVSIWVIFSLAHFIPLGHLNNSLDNTKSLLILIGFAVPLSDIFAYIVGSLFAKIPAIDQYKVASNLSPKKSYVGALGNVLGAGIGIAIMYFSLQQYLPMYHWIIIAILIGIAGIVGDITESMFKRYYGVKDSGDLIPGHGGVLDRIDSTMRVIVVLYYYLLFFV